MLVEATNKQVFVLKFDTQNFFRTKLKCKQWKMETWKKSDKEKEEVLNNKACYIEMSPEISTVPKISTKFFSFIHINNNSFCCFMRFFSSSPYHSYLYAQVFMVRTWDNLWQLAKEQHFIDDTKPQKTVPNWIVWKKVLRYTFVRSTRTKKP